MMKILDQSKEQLFSLDNNNIFLIKNRILISSDVNKYSGDTALLGEYWNKEDAEAVFEDIISNIVRRNSIINNEKIFLYEMPEKGEQDERK